MLVRFAAKSSCSLLPQRGRRRQRQLSRCQRTRVLDDGECAPPSGSAEAGAAAAGALDDGENAPPSGAAEAGAAATGVRDDGARHPAAQPRPGRQRRGCAMTASARHPAVPSLPKHMTIPKASSCTRTLAYAIVFIVSICYLYTSSALVSFLVAAIASRGALESSIMTPSRMSVILHQPACLQLQSTHLSESPSCGRRSPERTRKVCIY